ncbi:TonB-dependent receptor [Algibacter agarivorans]|uniref:TonB-dependent receptor n=1 Tax=Algibacter agarivorans TaxID=1109741 RepID=A0ABP9GDF0_9FLAO
MENASIFEIIEEIESKTEFKFFYSKNDLSLLQKVNIYAKKSKIEKVLEKVFQDSSINYNVIERQIILTPKKEKSQEVKQTSETPIIKQEPIQISGTVKDEFGMFLAGANIIEKGTANGAQSDFDGNFSIEVADKNSILVISYLGFVSQEIVVADQTTIDIVLVEDAASLGEIVVVGYGTQSKESITGAISSVKSEDLVRTPTTNTTASLAGRLPGLVVTQNNGQPGGDTANVSIRGFGNALVIVDGVPRDYQQLDPNTIASVSVLKDASAAVYGARAGNGVILVTTKRGTYGAPKINYSGSYTFQQPTFLPKMASPAGFARYQQQAELLEGVAIADLTYSDEDIAKYQAGTENGFRGTDWQDVVLKDWATTRQHNFNIQGGSENVKYFTSIGKLDQKSLLESGDGKFKRYNMGATIDAKISKRLDIGVNLKYREEETERPSGISGDNDSYSRIFRFLASMNPTVQQNPDGLLTAAHPLESNAIAYSTRGITGINDTKRKQFDAVLNFKYKLPFVEGLNFTGKVAHQTANIINNLTRVPFTTYSHDFETGVSLPAFTTADDEVNSTSTNFAQTTTQIGLDYKGSFGDHNLSGALILENRYIDNYSFTASRTGLLSSEIPYLFAGIGTQENGDSVSQDGRKGVVGRLNYDYQGKYLLEALFRADANIQFPTDTRWGYFPGVSLGWVVSKEDFMMNNSTIDFLKFRTSFASLGFDGTSSFDYLSGFGLQDGRANTYAYGSAVNTTLRTIGLANPTITWETMETFNFGIDARLWNSKLGVELDMFYRRRAGLLRDRLDQFPDTFGADLPQENLGVRSNRGFELVLTHKNNIGDVNFNIAGNITWTREKIIDDVEREFDPNDPNDARINQNNGQWANRRFGYRTDGFYDTQDEIDNDGIDYDPSIGEPTLGDVKYIDRNDDGTINWRDQEIIGRSEIPELFFGLSLNADYKGFDFSMLWQGAGNFDAQLEALEVAANTSIGFIPFKYQADNAWNASNPSAAKLPAPSTSGLNTHNNQTLDIYQRNGTYLRLKSLSLGYSIPESLLNKINLKSARVYVAGYNLLTIRDTGIFDFDPEARSNDGIATYPVQKNISLGVNIGL